ncbi:MAG: hypothetical protein GTO02_13495, partial [Candidatus Dadabacteria bacterium]|nr:hypothetical protein [Candidatus Dadabacteria bacterium]
TYHKYVDGAIVANNPSLVAVAQTQDVRNTQPHPDLKKIAIFSMGTIRDIYIEQRNAEWGYLMWSQSILQMITESDVLVANYIANLQYGE